MIRAGEFSGSMGDVLDRLTYLLEHENKIRNDVKSALRYPKIVLITLAEPFLPPQLGGPEPSCSSTPKSNCRGRRAWPLP